MFRWIINKTHPEITPYLVIYFDDSGLQLLLTYILDSAI